MSTSSSEGNDESHKKAGTLENGHRVKKMKLNKSKTKLAGDKAKKVERNENIVEPIRIGELVKANESAKAAEPVIVEPTKAAEPPAAVDPVKVDAAKDLNKKEFKTTTVKDMLRAQRDRQQHVVETHSQKGSSHGIASSSSDSDDSSEDSSSGKFDSSTYIFLVMLHCVHIWHG